MTNYTPTVLKGVKTPKKGEKPIQDKTAYPQIEYLFVAEMKEPKRTKANVLTNGLIAIDIEPQGSEPLNFADVQAVIEGLPYELVYYETVNSMPGYARVRVFLEPSRPMNEAEKIATTQQVIDLLGNLPVDPSCADYSRVHALPTITGLIDDFKVYHKQGTRVEVVEKAPSQELLKADFSEIVEPIDDETALDALEKYVEVNRDNLMEEKFYFIAIYTLAKACRNGEISEFVAYESARLLALGDPDWEKNNARRLEDELKNENIRTEYTFKQRFIDTLSTEITSMAELYEVLALKGEEWRAKHTTVNQTTGEVKVKPVTARGIADIMKNHCRCVLINEDDPEQSPLSIYDYDDGIYKKGERFIQRLMIQIERNSTKSSRMEATE